MLLLTGVGGGACLNLTISASTAIFLPIFDIESSIYEPAPFHGDDEASLTANSTGLLDESTGLFAEIDGVAVDLPSYRFVSPMFTWGPLPADNILGAPAGTTSQAVDAGYYLLLTRLGVGSRTIRFGGIIRHAGCLDRHHLQHHRRARALDSHDARHRGHGFAGLRVAEPGPMAV